MDKVLSDAQVVLLASSFPMSLKIALLRLDESAVELLTPLFHVRTVDVDSTDPKEVLRDLFRPGE